MISQEKRSRLDRALNAIRDVYDYVDEQILSEPESMISKMYETLCAQGASSSHARRTIADRFFEPAHMMN